MKRDLGEITSRGGGGGGGSSGETSGYSSSKTILNINKTQQASPSMGSGGVGKGKLWMEDEQQDRGGMDELLAVLGYKVRSSDMADVAQKLEQLEMVMGTAHEDGISYLSSDTVHYNPSDLSGWVQTMLSELNGTPINSTTDLNFSNNYSSNNNPPPQLTHQSSTLFTDDSEYDLRAIPGVAAYPTQPQPQPESETENAENSITRKRIKPNPQETVPSPSPSSSSVSEAAAPRPFVLIDSQETGIRLVHALLACAEAVQQENLKVADALVKHIGLLAASQVGAMRKVATYFAEALARRIYKIYPQDTVDPSYSDTLEMHFYETSPYLKFAHFTANQAILEAFANSSRVHVIDFGLKQGMQWPALMQALALRPGGPPSFRLTGIGPPQPDDQDNLQQVGWKLAQLAQTIGVEFEFRGFMASSLADLQPEILGIRFPEVEALAVNSVFELHRLLRKSGGMQKVLSSIKSMRPKIVTIVEQEANHNSPVFLDRFTEALHYYSSLFDSLEGPPSQDLAMSELYLGRQICNVVACEGNERVERHETLTQWRSRFESAGLEPVHLGSNAFKQAGMLLALFAGGDGYGVEEKDGCLMLGWHGRPLITSSAWKLVDVGDACYSELAQLNWKGRDRVNETPKKEKTVTSGLELMSWGVET